MLNHYFKINDHSNLNSSVMVQFGKIGNSNLDTKCQPDPTYFVEKLPSYYSSMAKTWENIRALTPDSENAEKSRIQFLNEVNPQIDWNSVSANQNPVPDSNGNIMGYEAAKSHYVLYEDQQTIKWWWLS
jgi:hypothetical protein